MTEAIIQNVLFDDAGLIPAVIQDAATGEVVGLCQMDSDTLVKTLKTGQTSFPGGENKQWGRLLDVRLNPDGSSITVLVERDSNVSVHGQTVSLMREFDESRKARSGGVSLVDVGSMEFGLGINKLYGLIAERREKRPEGSYTTYLFNSGLDKILKKVAEESGEVIIAAKNRSSREIVTELADLFYHLLVLMVERDVKLSEVHDELARRAAQAPQNGEG